MKKVSEYEEHAAECLRLAAGTSNEEHKDALYKDGRNVEGPRVRTQLSHQITVAAMSAPARKFLASLS